MSVHDRAAEKRLDLEPGSLLHIDAATPGGWWEAAHPDPAMWPAAAFGCCIGAAVYGPSRCTCWEPVFECEQQPARPGPIVAAPRMCSDCAYRADSPERADGYMAEVLLLDLPNGRAPFWCHSGHDGGPGMRRPVAYRHPHLGELPGDPSDWQPLIADGVPRMADGRPAPHCAGWAARKARARS